MNGAHLHLVVNHLPIIIPAIGLLILVAGFVFRADILKRTAYFLFIVASITAIISFATGEEAEEVVEGIHGITHQLIHEHEEAAETFGLLVHILAGLSLVGLWANQTKKAFSNIIAYVIIVLSVVTLFFAKQTGTTGGEIRHTEIRATHSANSPAFNHADSHEEEEHHDKD